MPVFPNFNPRTYIPGFVFLVRTLCHFTTKYRGTLENSINASTTLSPSNKATVIAFLSTVVAVCAILEAAYPPAGN